MTAEIVQTMRELHSRQSDGIHVRLLWCALKERVTVTVDDTKTGDAFAIEVHEGERAMDVFEHPFAYAANWTPEVSVTQLSSYPLVLAA